MGDVVMIAPYRRRSRTARALQSLPCGTVGFVFAS